MPDKIKKNTKTWIGVERVGAYMISLLTIYMKILKLNADCLSVVHFPQLAWATVSMSAN
jgi:hypothetical protein